MGFEGAEAVWVERFGSLRNVVRQEVIARQLAAHVPPAATVLDVGCGQGAQLLRIANGQRRLTGADPSRTLLAELSGAASRRGIDVEVNEVDLDGLADCLVGRRFDVVCGHGLLMYLPDRRAAIHQLTGFVGDNGLLSITFRNGDALAFRPGLRGLWAEALQASDGEGYVGELGVEARADRRLDVEADLAACGFDVEAWYGVRVLSDALPANTPAPMGSDLDALLDAEETAGRRDPYRALGSQLHLIARRHG